MAFKPYTYMRLLLLLQWNTSQNSNPAASIPTLQSAVYESSRFWDQQLFQTTTFRFWAVNLQNNVSSPSVLPSTTPIQSPIYRQPACPCPLLLLQSKRESWSHDSHVTLREQASSTAAQACCRPTPYPDKAAKLYAPLPPPVWPARCHLPSSPSLKPLYAHGST